MPEVPAVYFVEPSVENVQRICADVANGLYNKFYFNFSSSLHKQQMEQMALQAVKAVMRTALRERRTVLYRCHIFIQNAVSSVAAVVDRYLSFVSHSPSQFSLNFPNTFSTLNGTSTDLKVIL